MLQVYEMFQVYEMVQAEVLFQRCSRVFHDDFEYWSVPLRCATNLLYDVLNTYT